MKIDLKHLLDYSTVVQEVIDRFRAAKNAKVGDVVDVPEVRTRVAGQLWQIDAHKMRRLD